MYSPKPFSPALVGNFKVRLTHCCICVDRKQRDRPSGIRTEKQTDMSVQKYVSYTLADFSFAALVLTFRWIISERWDCQSGSKDSQVSVTVGVTDSGIKLLRLINLIRLCVKSLSKEHTASVAKRKFSWRKAVFSEVSETVGVSVIDK